MILFDLKMIPEHWAEGHLILEHWQGIINGIIVVGESRDECIVNAVELFPDLTIRGKDANC